MSPSQFKSPRNGHTIVLQPRGVRAFQSPENGLKKEHFPYARGSPPASAPLVVRASTPQPPPDWRQHNERCIKETYGGGDLLVRFGIDSGPGRMVARLLIVLVFFQPIYVAMGMELEEPTVSVVPEVSEANVPEVVVVDTRDDAPIQEEVVVTENKEEDQTLDVGTDVDIDVEEDGAELPLAELVAEGEGLDTGEGSVEGDIVDTDTTQGGSGVVDEGAEVIDTDTTEGILDESDVVNNEETEVADADATEESIEEDVSDDSSSDTDSGNGGLLDEEGLDIAEATSTDTEEVATTTQEEGLENVVGVVQDTENKYIFSEGDCTLVSDGEFYCVADGPERQVTGDPRVYSEKDREGDREIYYFDGVEVTRITNNNYDDFAPVFDGETMRIVWQAMLNDRLQIMTHEIPTNTTRQVTAGRQNSSNPSIAGDTVVWQEWVDTNWEVMMTDLDNGGQEFEIERLTDNAVHDMFPAAYDDLVTWQSERGDSWEVVVYDLRTGKRQILEKSEDTKYENPRFVLLFDSKHENGDVETIGYDLDTGKMMELGTKPTRVPNDPVTPKEETPDALPRESASSTQLKITSRENDTHDDVL